jgi:uridine kinase
VHNKIEHEKHLLRTVVLIKVLVDTRATGCITQQLSLKKRKRFGDLDTVHRDYHYRLRPTEAFA